MSNTFSAVEEAFKDHLDAAFSEVWEKVVSQLRGGVYVKLRGFHLVELNVVEGQSGETWWTAKLSDLVTDFLEQMDGTCTPHEPEWCDSIADDLEKQARRIYKHAEKLRKAP